MQCGGQRFIVFGHFDAFLPESDDNGCEYEYSGPHSSCKRDGSDGSHVNTSDGHFRLTLHHRGRRRGRL